MRAAYLIPGLWFPVLLVRSFRFHFIFQILSFKIGIFEIMSPQIINWFFITYLNIKILPNCSWSFHFLLKILVYISEFNIACDFQNFPTKWRSLKKSTIFLCHSLSTTLICIWGVYNAPEYKKVRWQFQFHCIFNK